jgi:hypothetical protein
MYGVDFHVKARPSQKAHSLFGMYPGEVVVGIWGKNTNIKHSGIKSIGGNFSYSAKHKK